MVERFSVSKPTRNDGVLLPMSIKQQFSSVWDTLYGLIVILGLCFVTWQDLDTNLYYLLIISYIDIIVIFDALFNIVIRGYQIFQVVAVNKNIEAVGIAFVDLFYLVIELIACLPFVSLIISFTYAEAAILYKCVSIFRFARLFLDRRKSLSKSKIDHLRNHWEAEVEKYSLSTMSLDDVPTWKKPVTTKKRKKTR